MNMYYQYQSGFALVPDTTLPLFRCPSLGFPHGFSTRLGGVSAIPAYESLDLGAGENSEEITENRRRFATALGSELCRMFSARQIHSAKIEYVTPEDLGKEFQCDGFITDYPELLLTVKTADCVPILFADVQNRIIGAVHAGWRGTVSGIADACIRGMTERGAQPRQIVAAIGPCIHACCYEVDLPFCDAVAASPYSSLCLPHIRSDGKGAGYRADLAAMNRSILLSCGLAENHIYNSGMCTSCTNELLFSHRAGKGRRGLMMAGIRMTR